MPQPLLFNFEEEGDILTPIEAAYETTFLQDHTEFTESPGIHQELLQITESGESVEDEDGAQYKDFNAQEAVDLLMEQLKMPEGISKSNGSNRGNEKVSENPFSKRKDVVYKTLIRKVRKYLQRLFNSSTKYIATKRFKPAEYYKEKITQFAQNLL